MKKDLKDLERYMEAEKIAANVNAIVKKIDESGEFDESLQELINKISKGGVMKINILFDTHGFKFTEDAIKEKMICSIIDRARNVVSKSTGKPLISIEDKNLLLEFARQIIDADENWDDGCPLCGSRI